MRNLLEEAELADQLGLDVFAIGEHHRPDFLDLGAGRCARGGRGTDQADPAFKRCHSAELR
jgi:alkanesulfonate monooxygenase SsuD/methylene tetrahydromethanopterin reductase-like flavin-dependent oxidoreductase (luciferase family)